MAEKSLALANGENLSKKYPQGVRWDIDLPQTTPYALIQQAIKTYPDHIALSFMGKNITYRSFGELIDNAAAGLQEKGVGKNTKVGLFMPNTPYYPIMFYATLSLNATVVNYSIASKDKEKLRAQIKDSDTSVMVTLDLKDFYTPAAALLAEGDLSQIIRCEFVDMLPEKKAHSFKSLNRMPRVLERVILFAMDHVSSLKKKAEDYRTLKEKLAAPVPAAEKRVTGFQALSAGKRPATLPAVSPQDVAVLQYTSGTSGTPKGAMLTHFNLAANALQMQEFFKAPSLKVQGEALMEKGKERVLSTIPLSHIFGETVLQIACLGMGQELILQADPRNVKDTLDLIKSRNPTAYPAAPALLRMLSEHPERKQYDISGMKTVIAGSEAFPPGLRRDLPELEISEGYGQTEASPVITCNLQGDFNMPGSVGIPLPRTEVRIANPDNPAEIYNIGAQGEIQVRGPQVMPGYYNSPKDTADVLTSDGWLRTGDVGYLDEKLFVHITDRLKRRGKVNGFQVYPVPVERKMSMHPAVSECVLIFLPDERTGETGKMLIKLKDDVTTIPTENDIRAFLKEQHISSHEMPRHIAFVTEPLLRTAVNKIDWKLIQDAERAKLVKLPQPKLP